MLWLGCVFYINAGSLCTQNRSEEARSEALCALAIFEKLGATNSVEKTRGTLERIEDHLDRLIG